MSSQSISHPPSQRIDCTAELNIHDGIAGALLDDYRRRLGETGMATRIRFEVGERPLSSGAFRRRHLFGPLTSLIIGAGRGVLYLSGLGIIGRRCFHDLQVVTRRAVIPRLPQAFCGYRILHLSDLHIDLDPTFVDTLVTCLATLEYDLCILTGDYRNHTHGPCDDAISGMLRLLPALHQPLYAVLGNHDRLCMVQPLEEAGCHFLLNEHVVIERDGAALSLIGVDDPCVVGSHDLTQATSGIPPDVCRLLLAHSPAVFQDAARHGIDYVFCGHTHGGQVCLPGGFILFPNDPSPRVMHRGSWVRDNTQGYTSPGTGACGIPARFNCPPEVTLHELCVGPLS